MAQDAINRYPDNLLDENNLSSYCYSKFYEIPFKELNPFPDNAKEIFKNFLRKNESEVADTYGISIVGKPSKGVSKYKIQLDYAKWTKNRSCFKTEFITRAFAAGLKRKKEESKVETELSSGHQTCQFVLKTFNYISRDSPSSFKEYANLASAHLEWVLDLHLWAQVSRHR
jgi:hypothetical protein